MLSDRDHHDGVKAVNLLTLIFQIQIDDSRKALLRMKLAKSNTQHW